MPKSTSVPKRAVPNTMGAAFDADSPRTPKPEGVLNQGREAKTATMTQKVAPSLRRHFQVSAKKEGVSLTQVIIEELLKRYPLPQRE